MKDTKFKAINREENYIKNNAPDMQLGRHERFTQNQPQKSTSRKMKTYQARQPTNDNTVQNTDTSYSSDTTVPSTVDYGVYDTVQQKTDTFVLEQAPTENHSELQISKSDAIPRNENTDLQKSVQHKNQSYQKHTQFSQTNTDYDFTKKNQPAEYNFTGGAEPQTTEQPEQEQKPSDDVFEIFDTEMENTSRYFNREHIPQEPPKKSSKIYRRHSQRYKPKKADYDISATSKETDYSFADKKSDTHFERAEHKSSDKSIASKQKKQKKRLQIDDNVDTVTIDKADVRKEPPAESEPNEDYNIYEAVENADTVFDRVSDTKDKSEIKSDIKRNKQLQQKQRLQTDAADTVTADEADTRKEATAEPEVNDDYDISEAIENTDTAFNRVEDTKDKTEAHPVKRKKNKRLQQKQRLRTDDTIPTEPAADKSETAQSEQTAENPSKDYQFKRAEKAKFKAEKARAKADKAEEKLPHTKKLKKERLYDENKKKPKNRLVFEKEVKPQRDLYHRTPINSAASAVGIQLANEAHSKVSEIERDNSAVEGAHKTERAAETLTRYSVRTARYAKQHIKDAPYRKAQRLQFKAEKAEVKAAYEKSLAENPDIKKSPLKKFRQKQQIKKQYQKAKRAEQSAKSAKKTAEETKKITARIVGFIKRHKKAFAIILLIAVVVCWLATTISSCAVMGTAGINSILTSSYLAEDEDIYMAEGYYAGLEADLQMEIDNIERSYSGYDEYNYDLAQIGHNPYELISYLTAKYECFTFADIETELDNLFSQQYVLTITEEVETRTDDEGNEYDYYILNVQLVNNNLNMLANTNLTDDQRELYGIYLETKGNRDYLFADDIYSNAVTPPAYTIPGEALSDETFRRLITEAERYLGYPYVWGGSSPSTSFDCSGFVCWVFQNSGVYPLSRTTAQGICNQCAIIPRSEAKPGDIIFFTGTYNAGEPVTHVGIYVGDGMMIHAGNPIQYTSVNTNYWTQHFYCFGRLGGG